MRSHISTFLLILVASLFLFTGIMPVLGQEGSEESEAPEQTEDETEETEEEDQAPLSFPEEPPFIGRVTGDDVRVRTGSSTSDPEVDRVQNGDLVVVRGIDGQWVSIEPRPGTGLWIYGEFLDETGNNRGQVTGTSVNLRPGPYADGRNVPVTQISEPTTLTILDREEREGVEFPWYQVQAPRQLRFWIHGDYVEHEHPYELEYRTELPGYQGEEAERELASREKQQELTALEERLNEQGNRPAHERDYSEIIADLEAYREDLSNEELARRASELLERAQTRQEEAETVRRERAQRQERREQQEAYRDRISEFRDRIQAEQQKAELERNYSDIITDLQAFEEEITIESIRNRVSEMVEELQDSQQVIENARQRLSERLAESEREERFNVEETIRRLVSSGERYFDATGYVESYGRVLGRPAAHQLKKGSVRLFFLRPGNEDMSLQRYRGRYVGIVGEREETGSGWEADVIVVDEIEMIR